jgi:DNA-binding transcriptional ArsR family regulator
MKILSKTEQENCCSPKPELKQRPLLSTIQATNLSATFKLLANDTRLRLLHAIVRAEEICVTDLANTMDMSTQAVSNQLQKLVDKRILGYRRNGNNIYYRIIDPCIPTLLDQGLCLMEDAKERGDETSVE